MNRKDFLLSLSAGSLGVALHPSLAAAKAKDQPSVPPNLSTADWSTIRALFPLREDRVYLNTGGLGPASQPALDALSKQSAYQAYTGEHHHKELSRPRKTAARFLGATDDEICFTRNASEANSIIASGLDLRAGDEVIFESHAHPGGSFPWLNRQKRDGVKVRIFEPSQQSASENLNRIFELVTPRTRVIQVSHLTATTGLLFDVAAIARQARRRGIWFHIDGAQSLGMIPFNLAAIGCDSYAASGHKWLNAPIETGVLYIKSSRNDEVACSHIGAYSNDEYELPDTLTYAATAQRHEYGTRNAAPVLGLQAAMELQESIGRGRIAAHGQKLARLARRQIEDIKGLEILTPVNPAMGNSILTFRAPNIDCVEIYKTLMASHQLRCRVVTERDLNGVRASWHLYHSEDDVARFAAGVKNAIKTLR